MRLQILLVDSPRNVTTPVLLDCPLDATADQLAESLEALAGTGRRLYFGLRELRGSATAGELGIADGDMVGIGAPVADPEPAAGVRLWVDSGPLAGNAIALHTGRTIIGRGEECGIRIPDSEVSRSHVELVMTATEVTVTDLGSANGTLLDGQLLTTTQALRPGSILAIGRTRLSLMVAEPPELELLPGADSTVLVKFQKRVDVHPLPAELKIRWPAEPEEPTRARIPWPAIVLPVIAAVTMALLLKRPAMLAFAALSPLMMLANFWSDSRRKRDSAHLAASKHREVVAKQTARMNEAAGRELMAHRGRWPGPGETCETALRRSGRLWQRERNEDDFLDIRIGAVDRATSAVRLEPDSGAIPPELPVLVADPIGLSLADTGVLGLQGPEEIVRGIARSILLQLGVFQSPHALSLTAVLRDTGEADFGWMRWLPHARHDEVVAVGNTPDAAEAHIARLAAEVRDRMERLDAAGTVKPTFSAEVALIEDTNRFDPALTNELLGNGPRVGVYSIVCERRRAQLPQQCTVEVNCAVAPEGEGWTAWVGLADGSRVDDVDPESIGRELSTWVARSVANLRPMAPAGGGEAGIPNDLRLLDLLEHRADGVSKVVTNWQQQTGLTLRVPFGQGNSKPAVMDLSAAAGAIVIGTPGSGKSQLLMSLVASAALTHSPEDISFVLVDFKGGGAFHRCAELPHTAAMVTNLDSGANRMIRALTVELERREALLRPFGGDLINYERQRMRDAGIGPKVPVLWVVIDEFAEFIGDNDELEVELESIARKGRSLGVRQILGTQLPGAVRGKIKDVIDVRVALRLQNPGDSMDVIGDPSAAHLGAAPRGRAYLRTPAGLDEVQVAAVGIPAPRVDRASAEPVAIPRPWGTVASPAEIHATVPLTSAEDQRTDLDDAVDLIAEATTFARPRIPVSPIPPSLPLEVGVSQLRAASGGILDPLASAAEDDVTPMWLEEHLYEQRTVAAGWRPGMGNLLIVGAQGAGRTSFLRTVAGTLADSVPPWELHLYCLDFEGALIALEDLPHCGAVADRNDPERVLRILRRLLAEMERRRSQMAGARVGSLDELARLPGDTPCRIMLMIDRWEYLCHEPGWDSAVDLVRRIAFEGPQLGLTTVLSSDVRASARVRDAAPVRVALRLSERHHYPDVLGDSLRTRDFPVGTPPGRGFRYIAASTDRHELVPLQVGHLGTDPSAASQNAALAEIGKRAMLHGEVQVPSQNLPHRFDPLPIEIDQESAAALGAAPAEMIHPVMVGVGGDTLEPHWVDLADVGAFAVAGGGSSGRSTFIASTATALAHTGTPVLLVAPNRTRAIQGLDTSELDTHEGSTVLIGRDVTADNLLGALHRLGGNGVLLVDDFDQISDSHIQAILLDVLENADTSMVAACDAEQLRLAMRGPMKTLAMCRSGLLLNPAGRGNDGLFGLRLSAADAINSPPGRGLLVRDGTAILVQTAV